MIASRMSVLLTISIRTKCSPNNEQLQGFPTEQKDLNFTDSKRSVAKIKLHMTLYFERNSLV